MNQDENQFYEECRECRHAKFISFDTMQCAKAAQFIPDTYCEEFEDIESSSNNHSVLSAADNIPEILEKEKEDHIKILEQEKRTEAVDIPVMETIEDSDGSEHLRFLTLQEVKVYNSSETKPIHVIRTIPKDHLVPYKKEVIRKGRDLFQLQEPNGKKAYVRKHFSDLKICSCAHVKKEHLDILLMAHDEFDQLKSEISFESNKIKADYRDHIYNLIDTVNNRTIVKTVDDVKEFDKEYSAVNILAFNTKVSNIELGRLQPLSIFFMVDDPYKKGPKKIILEDGTDGILLSKFPTYHIVEDAIESTINTISKIIMIGILLLGMGAIYGSTGFIFFWGIVILPIALLVYFFFSAPLEFVARQIHKRI